MLQIIYITSFTTAITINQRLANLSHGGNLITKQDPPKVMDGINQFRAEQCADRPEPWKHKECMEFMKKACNPGGNDGTEGDKPQMNGEGGEISSGKGFCQKFFNAQKEEEEKKKKEDERIPELEAKIKESEEKLAEAEKKLEVCETKYKDLEAKCTKDKKELQDKLDKANEEIKRLKKKLGERVEDTTPTTTTTGTIAIIRGQIGETSQTQGLPLYKPPKDNGEQDEEKGWDYMENGKDWTSSYCTNTEGQSPVDITRDIDIEGQTKFILWFDYYADPDREQKKVSSYIANYGHGIQFSPPENLDLGYIKLYRKQYTCKDYVFHSPSEHTLDGARFPLELQIINKHKETGELLGIALFFREGKNSNQFIKALMEAVGEAPRWNGKAAKKSIDRKIRDAFDLNLLVPESEQHPGGHLTFYNYEGSLTAPPCTTGVDWWVGSKPITALKDEIAYIQSAILESQSTKHGNYRETQPLAGRKIKVGMTNFQDAIKMPGLHAKADSVQEPRGFSTQDTPWVEAK